MMCSVISIPTAGLGNRLRHLISGKILSEQLGYDFIVNWPPDSYISGFDSMFNYNDHWKQYNNETCDFTITAETNGIYYSLEELTKYKNICTTGYSLFYFNIDVENWKQKARKYLNLLDIKQEIKSKLFTLPENTIGLHIRTGDNQESINFSPLNKFINIIEENQDRSIYLSTDKLNIENKLLETYSNIIVHKKFDYNDDGCVVNGDRYNINKPINDPGPTQDALVDMLMLSRTSKIYGSYWSSFSEWAAKFNDTPLIIVTANSN